MGIAYSANLAKNNNTGIIINTLNKSYVEIERFVNRNDSSNEEYLKKVCDLNNINAAIIDTNGNIYMKSKEVYQDIIDINLLKDIFSNRVDDRNLYQKYDIRLDNEEYDLLLWKEQGSGDVIIKMILSISLSFIAAIVIIYIYSF